MSDELFPKIKKGIDKLVEDEEGNIPGNKLLMLGTMIVVLGSLMSMDAFAGHRSHSSHKSHSSHVSGSGGGGGSHGSHVSHQSHESHQSAAEQHGNHSNHSNHASHSNTHSSHASHTSHSNTASHSNSRYSSEGDVSYAPEVQTIKGISESAAAAPENGFHLPDINQNIQSPNGTPASGIIPAMAVPDTTALGDIRHAKPEVPPETEKTE